MATQITHLALDLEGTLISTAVSVFARPGLLDFLGWCGDQFPNLIIFTAVPPDRAREVLRVLADMGEAPVWAANLPVLYAAAAPKDLRRVTADVTAALLVDDRAENVEPGQAAQWIAVPPWNHPYGDDDRNLALVREGIAERLGQAVAGAA